MKSGPIAIKAIEKFHNGNLVWIDGDAALQLGNQLRAPDLRFTFRAPKAVPAALTLAGHRIIVIKNDRPTAG